MFDVYELLPKSGPNGPRVPLTMVPSGRVKTLGDKTGTMVTAGMYLVPEHVRRLSVPRSLGRLRDFLNWLVTSGELVFGIPIKTVVDVDRAEDVPLAEALASASGLNRTDRRSEERT